MALLKKPAPVITKRQYHIRIDEPLAVKAERYAEFLGAKTIDHVITEALDYVFRKDSEFNAWLAEHPDRSPAKAASGNGSKPNGTMAAEELPEMAAAARSTI